MRCTSFYKMAAVIHIKWFPLLLVLAAICQSSVYGLVTTPQNLSLQYKFRQAAQNQGYVFIDVENVRGKSGFELSHADLIHSTSIWAKAYGLQNRVSLMVDHGSVPSGYYLRDESGRASPKASASASGLSIIFAGSSMKADDVIVRDIPFIQKEQNCDVIVVTQDTELIQRCKRAAGRSSGAKTLEIVKPMFFLGDLESIVGDKLVRNIKLEEEGKEEEVVDATYDRDTVADLGAQKDSDGDNNGVAIDDFTSVIESEIRLGAQLIALESQLRSKGKMKRSMSNKKRRKLEKMISKVRAKLGRSGSSTLSQATSIIANDGANGDGLDLAQQNTLLEKWQNIRNSSGRRELTGDRVLLAEGLRRELEAITGPYTSHASWDLASMVPAEVHANYVNSLIHNVPRVEKEAVEAGTLDLDEIFRKKETLRLVVVSDTHGMERSFTTDDFEPWIFTGGESKDTHMQTGENGEKQLPDGDVLLHLGDFAIDRGGVARRNALDRFDRWLSLQPHPIKIVVRGNHDPYTAHFPMSKAMYVTKPTTITLGSKVMAIIPYGHSGFSKSKLSRTPTNLLPPTCDILATHEPPFNALDKCLSGDRAGSRAIRSAVENMKGLPPSVWLCGHIHEGRGSLRMKFGSKHETRETMVINASNANPGRAHHLQFGPVVVDVTEKYGVQDDGSEDKPILRSSNILQKRDERNEDQQELLLAVDLGLRCGASLFDDSGQLLRYEQLHFSDPEDLYAQAPNLLDSWVKDLNSGENNDTKEKVLSYLAIEGGGELFDAWETSLDSEDKRNIQLVSVRPEEWRAHLLSPKERTNSRSCKEAARLIARQIVAQHGNMPKHEGKFKTDAAESVSMGFYMATRLGWIRKDPIVSRYTNGKIMVPR